MLKAKSFYDSKTLMCILHGFVIFMDFKPFFLLLDNFMNVFL